MKVFSVSFFSTQTEQVNAMAPTIDAELEQIDRKHAQLARISTDLVDALGLYHQVSQTHTYLPGIWMIVRCCLFNKLNIKDRSKSVSN